MNELSLSPHKWTMCCRAFLCYVFMLRTDSRVCERSAPVGKRGNPAQTFHGTDSQEFPLQVRHTLRYTLMLPPTMNPCLMYSGKLKKKLDRDAAQTLLQLRNGILASWRVADERSTRRVVTGKRNILLNTAPSKFLNSSQLNICNVGTAPLIQNRMSENK